MNVLLVRAASNIHEAFENCVASVVAQLKAQLAGVCHRGVRYLCDLNVQQANGASSRTIADHTVDC